MTPRLAGSAAVAGMMAMVLGAAALFIWRQFDQDIKSASARSAQAAR